MLIIQVSDAHMRQAYVHKSKKSRYASCKTSQSTSKNKNPLLFFQDNEDTQGKKTLVKSHELNFSKALFLPSRIIYIQASSELPIGYKSKICVNARIHLDPFLDSANNCLSGASLSASVSRLKVKDKLLKIAAYLYVLVPRGPFKEASRAQDLKFSLREEKRKKGERRSGELFQ